MSFVSDISSVFNCTILKPENYLACVIDSRYARARVILAVISGTMSPNVIG